MSSENQAPPNLTAAEQAELQRRFPRLSYWVRYTSRHPNIHNCEPDEGGQPRIHNITISVPLNTGAIGGIITRESIVVPTDISFDDLFDRLCAKMDLDPQGAILGYKFNRDLRWAPYTKLKDEDDLRAAMARGVDLTERARKRVVVLEIQNMQPAREMALASKGRKRNVDESGVSISRNDSDNAQKRIKTSTSSGAIASASSAININVANYIPLGDHYGQRCINAPPSSPTPDLPSISPSPPCEYPGIDRVLDELHAVLPYYNLPQYAVPLANHGIATVDKIRTVGDEVLVEAGLAPAVVEMFRDSAMRMTLIAEGYGVSQPRYY